MAATISVLNNKGGVGKSTTVCSLASLLDIVGKRVLVIDCDPQGNASQVFRVYDTESEDETYDLFFDKRPVKDIIKQSSNSNVHIIAAGKKHWNTTEELTFLTKENGRENTSLILRNRLKEIQNDYDFIIIDNSPARGILTDNILSASDYILIPVEVEGFSYEGIKTVISDITRIKSTTNPDLEFLGALFVMAEPRTNLFKSIYQNFIEQLGDGAIRQPIRKDNVVREANSMFTPLYRYTQRSKAGTDYIKAAAEMEIISKQEYDRLIQWCGLKNDTFDIRKVEL